MNKRARERARQERQEAKQEKRELRADEPAPEVVDENALMDEFARLSEMYSAEKITEGEYAEERRRIFEELGIPSDG